MSEKQYKASFPESGEHPELDKMMRMRGGAGSDINIDIIIEDKALDEWEN